MRSSYEIYKHMANIIMRGLEKKYERLKKEDIIVKRCGYQIQIVINKKKYPKAYKMERSSETSNIQTS